MPALSSPSAQRRCRAFGVGHSAIDALAPAYAVRDAGTACSAISFPLRGGAVKTIVRSLEGEQLLYCEVSPADTQQISDAIGIHKDVSKDAATLCDDGMMPADALAALYLFE